MKFLNILICLVCAQILFRCGSASSAEKYIIYASQQDFLKKVHDYKDNHPDNKRWAQYDRVYAPYEKSLGDTTVLFRYFDIYIPSEHIIFCCAAVLLRFFLLLTFLIPPVGIDNYSVDNSFISICKQ